MPGVYRLEYASSRRAGCRNTECKKADIKIEKNELRFGTQVPFEDKQTWHWKHWGCTTPVQIASLKGVIEGNLDYLDGYEDLTFEDQVKVQRALENGHIDDGDWRGDPERNRPGKKGFRTPANTLKQLDDEADNEDGSPSKRTPKKRGRAKDNDNDVEDEVEKPATKKAKAATKKAKKGRIEEADNESGDEMPLPKKVSVQRNKVKEEGSEAEAPPPKKARGQNKKVKAEADDKASAVKEEAADEPPMVEAAPKRTRLPRKAAEVKAVKEEDDQDELDEEMVEEAPKPKPGRKKATGNGAAKTAKGAKKGGATDAEGPKKATGKASRTKAA